MRKFDVASMAPPLKGQSDGDKHGLPDGAVISAAPKRYRLEGDDDGGMVTAAQIAMLGGKWKPVDDGLVKAWIPCPCFAQYFIPECYPTHLLSTTG